MRKNLLDNKGFNFFLSVYITLAITGSLLMIYQVRSVVPMSFEQAEAKARIINLATINILAHIALLLIRQFRNWLRSRPTKF